MKLTKEQKLTKLKARYNKLSDQRERYVNRYMLPLEIKMDELEEKIKALEE